MFTPEAYEGMEPRELIEVIRKLTERQETLNGITSACLHYIKAPKAKRLEERRRVLREMRLAGYITREEQETLGKATVKPSQG